MATKKVKTETEDLSSAIDSILRERKMNRNALLNAIEAALISAYKKNYGRNSDVRVTFDGRDVEITAQKSVVEEVQDPHTEITLEEAVRVIKRDTRHFAKRQLTWFRSEKEVIWLNMPEFSYDEQAILDYMLDLWQKKLREEEQRK